MFTVTQDTQTAPIKCLGTIKQDSFRGKHYQTTKQD